jgi:hypothetical protein
MQDSSAASGITRLVDIPGSQAYPRLVTKDTTLEQHDSERMGAADGDTAPADGDIAPNEAVPFSMHEGYYEKRHARFMAAVRGSLPLAEYLQEVVEGAGGRLPQPPPAHNAEH